MATQTSPPLDEIQYRRPDMIQWWLSFDDGRPHAPMDENMLHRYLAESPFFDHTTKNGLHMAHSRTNWRAFDLMKDRKAFEAELRRQKGTEYMIVADPQPVPGQAGGGNSGVWVIRKQDRDSRRLADGRMEEELTTLGTYYIVGENMYQAPSVGDIVGNRLLSAANSLSKFVDTAASLATFSPTSGYSYPTQSQSTTQAPLTSRAASPARSREGSVVPTRDTQSLRSGSVAPADSNTAFTNNTHDAHLLASSLKTALEFADEYIDENPLLGEPGHFSFTHSAAAVKRRRADEALAEASTAGGSIKAQQDASPTKGLKEDKAPSPPAVMTESKTAITGVKGEREKERRGSKFGEKGRRKKSRANLGSAVSPTTPLSASGSTSALS